MKRKIIEIALFSVAVIFGVFFLINYSHHDVVNTEEIKKSSINATIAKKCPLYYGFWDTTISGSKKCIDKFYWVEKLQPSNDYFEETNSKIFGTIKSLIISDKSTLYLDSGSYAVENTTIHLYIGKLVEIDQVVKTPKQCIPYEVFYVNDLNKTGTKVYGSDMLKIIEDKNYTDFTERDGTNWMEHRDCPPKTFYEVVK